MKLRELLDNIAKDIPVLITLREGVDVCADSVSARCMLKDCLLDREATIERNKKYDLYADTVFINLKEGE